MLARMCVCVSTPKKPEELQNELFFDNSITRCGCVRVRVDLISVGCRVFRWLFCAASPNVCVCADMSVWVTVSLHRFTSLYNLCVSVCVLLYSDTVYFGICALPPPNGTPNEEIDLVVAAAASDHNRMGILFG